MCLRTKFLSAVCVGAVLAGSAPAQRVKVNPERRAAEPPAYQEHNTFIQLGRGEIDYSSGAHKAILDKHARWYVNRLTWVDVQDHSTAGVPGGGGINDVVKQCLREFQDVRRAPAGAARTERQKRFNLEFGKALVPPIEEILDNKGERPIARINAARILGFLGETGNEEFADPLVKVVEDKGQLDAVKLYALRGLGELLASVERYKSPEREARAIQALITFVNRPAVPAAVEDINAFHYLRRAALEALAQCRAPAVELNKKVVSRPALDLVRVVSKDGFGKDCPAPTLRERIEAAVGLCQMRTKRYEKFYQPDYAAHQVGYFLADFLGKYMEERNKAPALKDEPWKIHSARLQGALQALLEQKENRKNAYLIEFVSKAESLLKTVESGGPVQIKTFRDWLEARQPPAKSLYKNDDKAVVSRPPAEV